MARPDRDDTRDLLVGCAALAAVVATAAGVHIFIEEQAAVSSRGGVKVAEVLDELGIGVAAAGLALLFILILLYRDRS